MFNSTMSFTIEGTTHLHAHNLTPKTNLWHGAYQRFCGRPCTSTRQINQVLSPRMTLRTPSIVSHLRAFAVLFCPRRGCAVSITVDSQQFSQINPQTTRKGFARQDRLLCVCCLQADDNSRIFHAPFVRSDEHPICLEESRTWIASPDQRLSIKTTKQYWPVVE